MQANHPSRQASLLRECSRAAPDLRIDLLRESNKPIQQGFRRHNEGDNMSDPFFELQGIHEADKSPKGEAV